MNWAAFPLATRRALSTGFIYLMRANILYTTLYCTIWETAQIKIWHFPWQFTFISNSKLFFTQESALPLTSFQSHSDRQCILMSRFLAGSGSQLPFKCIRVHFRLSVPHFPHPRRPWSVWCVPVHSESLARHTWDRRTVGLLNLLSLTMSKPNNKTFLTTVCAIWMSPCTNNEIRTAVGLDSNRHAVEAPSTHPPCAIGEHGFGRPLSHDWGPSDELQLDTHLCSSENKNNVCVDLKGNVKKNTKCCSTCVDLLCYISAVGYVNGTVSHTSFRCSYFHNHVAVSF